METRIRLYLAENPVRDASVIMLNPADPWSKSDDLKNGTVENAPYATFEPNYWLLDGSYKFMPADKSKVHLGYMGNGLTDANATIIPSGYRIDVALGNTARNIKHISIHGLDASNDYVSEVVIDYVRAGTVIASKTFQLNEYNKKCENAVDNVELLRIYHKKTSKPFRRPRVTAIGFDDEVTFAGSEIIEANLIRETSLLSTELPYGIFRASLFADNNLFDITNPNSLFSQLRDRMVVDVFYDNDRSVSRTGRYYLYEWKNLSDNKISIEAMDIFGLMEDTPYMGDHYKTNADVRTLVTRVLSLFPAIKTIELDSTIPTILMRGFLEPSNVREALQQVLFAAGLTAKIQGTDKVYITYQRYQNIMATPVEIFDKSRKALDNQSLTLIPPVTRLELTTHNYRGEETLSTVFESELSAGKQTIMLPQPAWVSASNVTGATVLETYANYLVVNVPASGKVTVKGNAWVDSKTIVTREVGAGSTSKPNVVKIDKASLITPDNVGMILDRLENYYLLKFEQKWQSFNPDYYDVGEIVQVDTVNGKRAAVVVSKVNVNLSKGCVCDFTGVGMVLSDDTIQKLKKTIGTDGRCTVLPSYFYYPYAGLQQFTATLKAEFYNTHQLAVVINGSKTVYAGNSAVFTLNNPTQFTEVMVQGEPLAEKAINAVYPMVVTPAKFRYPVAADQSFVAKYPNGYGIGASYIAITIDGQRTLYDIAEKNFVLSNTKSTTTVTVESVMKSTKDITVEKPSVSANEYRFDHSYSFYYPAAGKQTLFGSVMAFDHWDEFNGQQFPIYRDGSGTFQWYVNGSLKVTHSGVSNSLFELENATESTNVRLVISGISGAGGGSSTGGGSSYKPWNGTISLIIPSMGAILRDSPTGGNFKGSLAHGDSVEVIGQQNGDSVSGISLWYKVLVKSGQSAGLDGWVLSSSVSGSNPN